MKTIGKYEVRGLLGRGGMGAVYKVKIPGIDKYVALKLLAPRPALSALLEQGEIKRRFVTEAKIMGRLHHPHIASVWDFRDDPNHTYYVMEYYCRNLGEMIGEGYDLEAPTRPLAEDKAVRYIGQTLKGLARLHHAGIVHRDIKPHNLLVTEEDEIKITDFGLSKLRGEPFSAGRLHIGSPYYAAPEQEINPDNAGPASDLYSAGVTLHRLLTGLFPESILQPPEGVRPELDPAWDAFFQNVLARDPALRFSDAPAMNRELHRIYQIQEQNRTRACRLDPPSSVLPEAPGPRPRVNPTLRCQAIKVAPGEARQVFNLDDLNRPAQYHTHAFVPRKGPTPEASTVADLGTGLVWQTQGSEYTLTWNEASEYIDDLNHEARDGLDNWRLPTMDELLSLLSPPPEAGDYCLEPIFDRTRTHLWSSDRRSAVAAWYVNTDLGYAGFQENTCRFHVRAVSSMDLDDDVAGD